MDMTRTAPKLLWLDSFEMGIRELDKEHKQLFTELNELMDCLEQVPADEEERAALTARLAAVITHHKAHYAHEETLMARRKYAGLETHAREHRRLEKESDMMFETFTALPPSANEGRRTLALRIRDGLLDHFLHYDLRYKSHMLDAMGR
jgi:hemerythrin